MLTLRFPGRKSQTVPPAMKRSQRMTKIAELGKWIVRNLDKHGLAAASFLIAAGALGFQIKATVEGNAVQEALLVNLSWQNIERSQHEPRVDRGQSQAFADLANRRKVNHAKFSGLEFNGPVLEAGAEATHLELRNTKLSNVFADRAKLESWSSLQLEVVSGSFRSANLNGSTFSAARLFKFYAAGAGLSQTFFVNSNITMIQAPSSDWRGATIIDTEFHTGSLKGAKFQTAILVGVQFHQIDMNDIDFRGAVLRNVHVIYADPVTSTLPVTNYFDGACALKGNFSVLIESREWPRSFESESVVDIEVEGRVSDAVFVNGQRIDLPACDLDYIDKAVGNDRRRAGLFDFGIRSPRNVIRQGINGGEYLLVNAPKDWINGTRLYPKDVSAYPYGQEDPPNEHKQMYSRVWWLKPAQPHFVGIANWPKWVTDKFERVK